MGNDTRKFLASGFLVLVLIALVAYLTFIPVPPSNKELIITVIGVLVGAGSAAIPNLVGDPKSETEKLKKDLEFMRVELDVMRAQYNEVKTAYDTITKMLIERHVVLADGIQAKDES
jgi:hypothetical protein